jgi:hypothetical protein
MTDSTLAQSIFTILLIIQVTHSVHHATNLDPGILQRLDDAHDILLLGHVGGHAADGDALVPQLLELGGG